MKKIKQIIKRVIDVFCVIVLFVVYAFTVLWVIYLFVSVLAIK